MRRSSAERRPCHFIIALLPALAAGTPVFAQLPGFGVPRLVDVVQVSDNNDQVDLTMIFNCSMRFVTQLPASEGREVHIQLAPLSDCGVNPLGQLPAEIPPLSGGAGIVSAARLESLAPGQVTLTLSFVRNEHFVLAQGADLRGLRLRLIDHARHRGSITVGQGEEAVNNFAINLDAQPKPFDPTDIERAHERLHAPAFVSETEVDGEKWYRLRIGPIERRSEADRLLNLALSFYPRAWLAIGDDAVTSDPNLITPQLQPLPPVEKIGTDPPLAAEELKSTLAAARTALGARDYPKAIALLTKLQRQPEFPERARAQELLGLARERAGQLAHAKAEYEEYLRRYPNGEAAERVALRLRILRAAEARARTGREASAQARGWEVSGDWSQLFRYDGSSISNGPPPPNTQTVPLASTATAENAVFNDLDLLARRRGESIDWIARLSAGYDKSFQSSAAALGNPTRVSLASLEVLDRPLGVLGRVGRQVSVEDGILGTFDGIFLSWQFKPAWSVNAAAGYPVEQLILAPQTQERFETLGLHVAPPGAHWDGGIFASTSEFQGLKDRQAVGLEARYVGGAASLVTVVDYDTFYHSLNTASLIGTLLLPARFNVSFDAERRNSPVLTTRNALVGQTFTDIEQLEQVFTQQQIYQLARDRTPITSDYSVTITRPLGQRFQLTAIVTGTETAATPASGGVAAVAGTGMLLDYQAQLAGTDLWHAGDFSVVTLTTGNTEIGRIDSIAATSRFPIGGAWRLGPRFTVDRLTAQI